MAKCKQKCEVYSRVVGYYRPIADWNIGKREEYGDRRVFREPDLPTIEEQKKEMKNPP